MYKILVVEDDEGLRNQVVDVLRYNNYEVNAINEFTHVLENVEEYKPDLIILDINLPGLDGNFYCHAIRKKHSTPIIMTTARNSDSDQILSMELGSDDYIIKPFNINVLISRINACLRRTYGEYVVRSYEINGLRLDEAAMKLCYGTNSSELSKNEFKIIKVLIANADRVVTRETLLEEIWDDKDFVDDNTLTVNITRIKKKLEDMGLTNAIQTKRGVGYILCREALK